MPGIDCSEQVVLFNQKTACTACYRKREVYAETMADEATTPEERARWQMPPIEGLLQPSIEDIALALIVPLCVNKDYANASHVLRCLAAIVDEADPTMLRMQLSVLREVVNHVLMTEE